jgi:transposase
MIRLRCENAVRVGSDELNRRKRQNYLTGFVDLLAKRVLFAIPGKDAEAWESLAGELLRDNWHPKAIRYTDI